MMDKKRINIHFDENTYSKLEDRVNSIKYATKSTYIYDLVSEFLNKFSGIDIGGIEENYSQIPDYKVCVVIDGQTYGKLSKYGIPKRVIQGIVSRGLRS